MCRKVKYLLTGLLILLTVGTTTSQIRTYSPYSRYGLGEFSPNGFGRNSAMGGTGIGVRTNQHLNSLNPASYSAIDSMSFFFETGVSGKIQVLQSGSNSQTFSDMNLDYFAFGFPVSRNVSLSFGLKPAANAGYEFEIIQNLNSEPNLYTAKGAGNISSVYGGLSYKISSQLSVGAHASFWFGDLRHFAYQEFLTDRAALKYGMLSEHRANSFILDFGIQNTIPLGTDQKLVLGAVFRPTTNIGGESSFLLARGDFYDTQGSLFTTNDTIESFYTNWRGSSFDLPMSMGVGASYIINNKLTLAADYMTQLWSDTQFPDSYTETANTSLFAFGAEFIPNERTGLKYFQRIRYRAGLRYHEDYIKYNGSQIKDLGMSFGLGLPLGRSNTSINLGFEYGNKGTGESGDLKETYGRFTLNFTLHELWFAKRRFE
jgi:hypothetical protein